MKHRTTVTIVVILCLTAATAYAQASYICETDIYTDLTNTNCSLNQDIIFVGDIHRKDDSALSRSLEDIEANRYIYEFKVGRYRGRIDLSDRGSERPFLFRGFVDGYLYGHDIYVQAKDRMIASIGEHIVAAFLQQRYMPGRRLTELEHYVIEKYDLGNAYVAPIDTTRLDFVVDSLRTNAMTQLVDRHNAMCRNIAALTKEIRADGYEGPVVVSIGNDHLGSVFPTPCQDVAGAHGFTYAVYVEEPYMEKKPLLETLPVGRTLSAYAEQEAMLEETAAFWKALEEAEGFSFD